MSELSSIIKSARESSRLTIREAEAKSGISNAYLSQIENDKIKNPSFQILNKISKLYEIPLEILMEKSGYSMSDYGNNSLQADIKSATVLISDDNKFDRELFINYLSFDTGCRYVIKQAKTGMETIESIKKDPPDCLILDYKLPDMDGLDVLQQISESKKMSKVPVIMMTGYGSEDIAVAAMKLGAVNYLIKDKVSRDEFISAVNTGVKRKILWQSMMSKKAVKTRPDSGRQIEIIKHIENLTVGIDELCRNNASSPIISELTFLKNEAAALSKLLR